MRRLKRRGYTPLPAHLRHLDPPHVIREPEIGPLPGYRPIRSAGKLYHAGYQANARWSLELWHIGADEPDGIRFIRQYARREDFNAAWLMLQGGATEDEIVNFEHIG